jgi:hypothetical protein
MSEFERADLAQNIMLERIKYFEINRTSPLSNNNVLKSLLRMNNSDELEVDYFKNQAVNMVENRLRKTIFRAKRKHRHNNDTFVIPYGPIYEEGDIQKVRYGSKHLTKGDDYKLSPCGDSFRISLNSRVRRGDRVLTVEYEAGFKKIDDIPSAIVHAIVSIAYQLFQKGDNPEEKEKLMKSLLHEYDTGEGGLF